MALFDRVGRRVPLTPEGDDLRKRSHQLLADAEALAERAKVLKGGQSVTLRISATPQVIETFLAPFLPRYLRKNPGVEVHFLESGGPQQVKGLAESEVQLALMAYGFNRFHGQLLYPIHLLAVMQEKRLLGRSATLEISKLAEEPLLILSHEFGARSWFDSACDDARINPRVVLESRAPHTLLALARVGYGIAIVPSNVHFLPSLVRAVPLVHLGQAIGRWSVIAWNAERFLAAYAQRFVDELVDHASRAYPGRGLVRRAPSLTRPE